MKNIDANFWNEKYTNKTIGWDIGKPSPPLVSFFETLENKNLKILFPGCGNAYEAEYLYNTGFKNVFVLDYVKTPLQNLQKRCPDFPNNNLICEDFFSHNQKYDIVVELAFFTAIEPSIRPKFALQISKLLKNKGFYMGLFFNKEFGNKFPPFGAYPSTYKALFEKKFIFEEFYAPKNSIAQRAGNEIFFKFRKK